VRFAMRYLIDRGIKGGCEIDGAWVPGNGVTRVYSNPTLSPADVDVEPRVLSFDIETDGKGDGLLAISLYAPGIDEVLIVDSGDRPMPERATRCADERAVLDAFCARVKEFDPDVLLGWNVIDFDLTGSYRVTGHFAVIGVIQNLLDRPPPFNPLNYAAINYNPAYSQAGIIGRYFRLGLTYTL